jgi:hypothetical protein
MRFFLLGSGKDLVQNQEKEKTTHGVVAAPSLRWMRRKAGGLRLA